MMHVKHQDKTQERKENEELSIVGESAELNFNQLLPTKMNCSGDRVTAFFPVTHDLNSGRYYDEDAQMSPHKFFTGVQKKKELQSSLEVAYTRKDETWSLCLTYQIYMDFIDYQLKNMLDIFITKEKSSSEFKLQDQKGHAIVGTLNLSTRTTIIEFEGTGKNTAVLNEVLEELLKHEGSNPISGVWIPVGSIRLLKQAMHEIWLDNHANSSQLSSSSHYI